MSLGVAIVPAPLASPTLIRAHLNMGGPIKRLTRMMDICMGEQQLSESLAWGCASREQG